MMCDGCVFLSFNLKIDSIWRVCHMIKKLNLHFVYVLSFFKNFLLSTSFVLQKGRRIPSLGLSSNQWTGKIVSSLLGFSKSWITLFINFAGYPALTNDCLMALTSSFQLEAIRFDRCKALRIVLGFHLSYFDNVMTNFIVNSQTDALKTDINFCFFTITNCQIVRSRSSVDASHKL